jgi:uncharacterized membrane protein YuzA (DUF378 family)
MAKLPVFDLVALILVIIGGLNWGLVGAFKFNLVDTLLAFYPALAPLVYDLVGLAAIYLVFIVSKLNKS